MSEQLSEKIARELESHLDPYFRLNRDWREQVAVIIQRHLSESQTPVAQPEAVGAQPQAIYFDFDTEFAEAFKHLYNMVIFALDQGKAGVISRTCATMQTAERVLTRASSTPVDAEPLTQERADEIAWELINDACVTDYDAPQPGWIKASRNDLAMKIARQLMLVAHAGVSEAEKEQG